MWTRLKRFVLRLCPFCGGALAWHKEEGTDGHDYPQMYGYCEQHGCVRFGGSAR